MACSSAGNIAARGIEVASSVEEFFSYLVAGNIAYRPKRDPYAVLFGVFSQEGREMDAFHGERKVYVAFGVAFVAFKAFELFACHRDEGGSVFGINTHFLVKLVSLQPKASFAAGVIDVAINLVLVDAFLDEFGYDAK